MLGRIRSCRVTIVIASLIGIGHCRSVNDLEASRLRGGGRTSDNPAGGARLQNPLEIVSGHYFGLNFRDDPFAVNVWQKGQAEVVENLDPVAPFDRMNKPYYPIDLRSKDLRLSGAAQVEPGQKKAAIGYTKPDYVAPFLHPRPFPDAAEEALAAKAREAIIVPIGERSVVASADRMRDPRYPLDEMAAYPLTAPADRINPGPYPLSPIDSVPTKYDRFIAQSMQRASSSMALKDNLRLYDRVDQDKDNAISHEEFTTEVGNHQGKTEPQVQVLWEQYHITPDPDMTKEEFVKLASTGFDLGQAFVPRKDITLTLTTPEAAGMGYWGGGVGCPNNTYVIGARIKVKKNEPEIGDNTALNCLQFKCSDGSLLHTVEGPDGAWTDWAECLPGQTVGSVSVRVKAHASGLDNTGINDLMFQCRSPGHTEATTLMFGNNTPVQDQSGYIFVNGQYVPRSQTTVDDKQVVVGMGTVAKEGGWSDELSCGTNGAICGGQGRLLSEPEAQDNMGITEFRFFCCEVPLDCSNVCVWPSNPECHQCQAKQLDIKPR